MKKIRNTYVYLSSDRDENEEDIATLTVVDCFSNRGDTEEEDATLTDDQVNYREVVRIRLTIHSLQEASSPIQIEHSNFT